MNRNKIKQNIKNLFQYFKNFIDYAEYTLSVIVVHLLWFLYYQASMFVENREYFKLFFNYWGKIFLMFLLLYYLLCVN